MVFAINLGMVKWLVLLVSVFQLAFFAEASELCLQGLVAQHEGYETYDFVAGQYVAYHTPVLYQLRAMGYEYISKITENRILILGEGYSRLALSLHEYGKQVHVVDPVYSPDIDFSNTNQFIQAIRDQYNRFLAGRIHAVSSTNTGLPAESFELILANKLINNLVKDSRIEATFEEAARLLEPGGKAIFTGLFRRLEAKDLQLALDHSVGVKTLQRLQADGVIQSFEADLGEPIQVDNGAGEMIYSATYRLSFTR